VRSIPFCEVGFQNSFDKARPADLRCRAGKATGSSETVVLQNRSGAGLMQVLDTVGWVGDGDDTDFFLAIERTFDLRLRSNLPWTTFGEVRDHVIAHVIAHGGGGTTCATQMTFYRLRRALGLGRRVGPDEPLAPLIGDKPRQSFTDLEADTNLKMPATRAGWPGIAGGLCFAIAVAILAFTTWAPPLRIFAAGATAYAGLWLRHIDRRRLPHGCKTLGDLARPVTEQNRGRLARDGARLTAPEVWRIIQQLAAEESGVDPDLIGPETTFFRTKARAA
jgi:hypothetical protein